MRLRSPDIASIAGGIVVVALGAILFADATGILELSFEILAPIACAAVGAILLAAGLARDH